MEEIRRQVGRARRRLVLQQFLGVLPWALFVALVVSVIGLAIPKLWPIGVDAEVWMWSWVGGGAAAGLLFTIVWTFVIKRGSLDAAIEIDRRFGLKERVSSALALEESELETEAGQALLNDAIRRVETIEVREKFGVSAGWRALLPLAPALAAFLLVLFVADAQEPASASSTAEAEARARVKKAAESAKNRIAKKKKVFEKAGLEDSEDIFKKVTEGFDELAKKDTDRKKALIKINDLTKQLAEKRKSLGGSENMKKQLEKLKKIERGPADKVADALKEGEFGKAVEELNKLQEKLEEGKLSEQEKAQLQKQMEQMAQAMQDMADKHQAAKEELERQIQQKMAEGDLEAAGELQRKLDKLKQMDQSMEQMQQMSEQLAQAAEAMQNGDMKQASQQLSQMSSDLQEMQAQLEQLESLDEIMDEIADAKEAMNCEDCQGGG